MRLVHTWLSSPAYASIRGTSGVVLADDLDAVAELVAEHHQRALEALGHVDRLHRGAVHLRVGPHRADELGDPPVGLLHLGRAAWTRTACSATHSRPGSRAAPSEHAGRPLAPRDVDARPRRASRRASHPCVDAVAGQPVGELVLAVGDGQRVRRPPVAARARGAARRAQRTAAAEISPLGQPAERGQQRPARVVERVDRSGRGGRRVVDLVREPGRERAEGDQRLALPGGRLDAAGGAVQPLDQVPAEREPRVDPLPQQRRRARGAPGPRRTPRRWRGRRRARPRPGTRRPSARARPSGRRRCPRGRRGGPGRWRRRPAPTRSPPARPRGRRPRPARSPPRRRRRPARPAGRRSARRKAERAQVVDAHQIVAR